MPICFQEHGTICFEDSPGDDDAWLRADVAIEGGHVFFDRGGLCRLNAADCRQLAAWLTARAAEFPPDPERKDGNARSGYGGRHNRRRRPSPSLKRQTSDAAA